HVLAYFGLGIIAFRGTSLKPLLSWPSRYLQALGIAALYGVTDEYHQSFVPGRRCELYDWMADVLGAAVALSLIAILQFYRRKGGKRVERRRQGI
ncbi:MAG: VanZ family protein, partial [Armatimonadota bacterium]|nr:VanZ family protein [Armatimonadota bacterium]